jgi:effector-binding domain-containing protein
MKYEIQAATVAEQVIAASRRRTNLKSVSKEIQSLLGFSWAFIQERALSRRGHNVAIYWDDSVEPGVQVAARFEDTADVVCSATPAGRVATTAHYGPYSELGAAHQAVRDWCKQNGHEIVSPFWEIYGHWNDDWAQVRTDVLYLLK